CTLASPSTGTVCFSTCPCIMSHQTNSSLEMCTKELVLVSHCGASTAAPDDDEQASVNMVRPLSRSISRTDGLLSTSDTNRKHGDTDRSIHSGASTLRPRLGDSLPPTSYTCTDRVCAASSLEWFPHTFIALNWPGSLHS